MRFVFFDFDGTLSQDETIEIILHDYPDIMDRMKEMNQMGLRGVKNFGSLYLEKIQLMKGLPYQKILEQMKKSVCYFKGVKETIQNLKNDGWKVIVLSGGFNPMLETAKNDLGFDTYFGNDFDVDLDGNLTGFVRGPCMHQDSKGEFITKMIQMLGISKTQCVGVGDARNDISMFQSVGFSVAFCAKTHQVRDSATTYVDIADMNLVYDKIAEYDRTLCQE